MGRVLSVALTLCALLAAGCTSVDVAAKAGYNFSEIEKIAVLDVTGRLDEGSKNQIGDFLYIELMKKGYSVIERRQVKSILGEQEFQQSDFTSTENAARVGEVLNVPAVIVVNMSELAEQLLLTVKLIEVETAEIVWIGSVSGTTGRTAATVAGAVVGGAAGVVAAGGSRGGRIVTGAAGGVLGAVAGRALTPSEMVKVKKMVKKVGARFPSRLATTR